MRVATSVATVIQGLPIGRRYSSSTTCKIDLGMIDLHDLKGIIDDEGSRCGADLLPRMLGAKAPAGDCLRIQIANPPQDRAAGNRLEVLRGTAPVHLLVDVFRFDARLLEIVLVDGHPHNPFALGIELNGAVPPSTGLVD